MSPGDEIETPKGRAIVIETYDKIGFVYVRIRGTAEIFGMEDVQLVPPLQRLAEAAE